MIIRSIRYDVTVYRIWYNWRTCGRLCDWDSSKVYIHMRSNGFLEPISSSSLSASIIAIQRCFVLWLKLTELAYGHSRRRCKQEPLVIVSFKLLIRLIRLFKVLNDHKGYYNTMHHSPPQSSISTPRRCVTAVMNNPYTSVQSRWQLYNLLSSLICILVIVFLFDWW